MCIKVMVHVIIVEFRKVLHTSDAMRHCTNERPRKLNQGYQTDVKNRGEDVLQWKEEVISLIIGFSSLNSSDLRPEEFNDRKAMIKRNDASMINQ